MWSSFNREWPYVCFTTSELSIEVSAVDRKNANHPLPPADGLVKPCSVITLDFKPECLVKNPDPLQMEA